MLASCKAEVSTEFIAFFGILLLFFAFFAGIIGMKNSDINESTMYNSANNILNTVVDEINTASRIDGYHREFFIPGNLPDGEAYNITYNNTLRIVKIEWDQGKNIIENIETNNLNGNLSAGYNMIENVNGEVNISAS